LNLKFSINSYLVDPVVPSANMAVAIIILMGEMKVFLVSWPLV